MDDATYMERALDLAALGREWVSPNPMVGCVIVHDHKIIGEGLHQAYGQAHAEINALENVKDKTLIADATVYVTLEPCVHHGKTPPCTDALIQQGVKRVVICNEDPFPQVSGKGAARLRAAGITVETGLLAQQGEALNQRFFKVHRTGLPYIILKWAETADGFIAGPGGVRAKISNSVTDLTVHRWRAEEDAILVGKNTVLSDNPHLNVRHWTNDKQPVRVILGSGLETTPGLHIFDNRQKTLIYNRNCKKEENQTEFIPVTNLPEVLQLLTARGINSLLVEGGKKIHEAFLSGNLFDEIRVIKSTKRLKAGITAPTLPSGILLEKNIRILDDQLFFYRNIPTF